MAEFLAPDREATVEGPFQPPNWIDMGWSSGWVVNETTRGIQWWSTPAEDWERAVEPMGSHRRQWDETFAGWYRETLERWSRELGKPFDLEAVYWRRMDLPAVGRKELVQEGSWYRADVHVEGDFSWRLVFPVGFVDCFEDATATMRPPWTFEDVWQEIGRTARAELLRTLGVESGARTHLASLIVDGMLEAERVFNDLPRTPEEDVRDEVQRRNDKLDQLTSTAKDQTLSSWRSDALAYLTSALGESLLEGQLTGSAWKQYHSEWKDFQEEKLAKRVGTQPWAQGWEALNPGEWEFIVPRLPRETLERASSGLPDRMLDRFNQYLGRELKPPAGLSRLEVYRARSRVLNKLKQLAENLDADVEGRWEQALTEL